MQEERRADDLAEVWRALGNSTRRRILDLLFEESLATGELASHFPSVSRFAVMQHLRVLEEGALVIRQRRGRQVINHLNPVPIQQIYQRWVQRYQAPWAETLVALKGKMEDDQGARLGGRAEAG